MSESVASECIDIAKHPQAWQFAQFLAGRTLSPEGLTFEQLQELPAQEFLARPQLLDWLLPTDWPMHPDSTAPVLDLEQAKLLYANQPGRMAATDGYYTFVFRAALVIDHHGWLFHNQRASVESEQLRERRLLDTRMASRALRLLELSGLQGRSYSDPTASFYYVDGLYQYLCRRLWALYGKQQAPPLPFGSRLPVPPAWQRARELTPVTTEETVALMRSVLPLVPLIPPPAEPTSKLVQGRLAKYLTSWREWLLSHLKRSS